MNGQGNARRPERVIIGGLRVGGERRWQVEESLDELAALVQAAGGVVVERVVQERVAPSPALYFGRGKAEEIGQIAGRHEADLFVSDDALSPVQERNLTQVLGIKVIDRTALILDIFAQRARTSEGKLQVELAQLTYLMPRLVGQWKHLERLGGGIGTRGPGETQLESDRRVIRTRVRQITRDLERVKVHRRVQRGGRQRAGWPVVALVGYTNAGKTTLLNRLTGASLTAADQLFVTLDPVARLVNGDHRPSFVLTDTVGFIRKLPHELVAAFRATLEELAEADVLLHVVDASHPQLEEHLTAVETLLDELHVAERPRLLVLNKLDRLEDSAMADGLVRQRGGVAVSARTGEGLAELLDAIGALLPRRNGPVTLRIPHAEGAVLASCYTRGRVLMRADEPQHVRLRVELPVDLLGPLATYRV